MKSPTCIVIKLYFLTLIYYILIKNFQNSILNFNFFCDFLNFDKDPIQKVIVAYFMKLLQFKYSIIYFAFQKFPLFGNVAKVNPFIWKRLKLILFQLLRNFLYKLYELIFD